MSAPPPIVGPVSGVASAGVALVVNTAVFGAVAAEGPSMPSAELFSAVSAAVVYAVLYLASKAFLTVYFRLAERSFPTAEDYTANGLKLPEDGLPRSDVVERVRSSVRNDLESLPAVLVLLALLAFTNAPVGAVKFFGYSYTALRAVYSYCYISGVAARGAVWALSQVSFLGLVMLFARTSGVL